MQNNRQELLLSIRKGKKTLSRVDLSGEHLFDLDFEGAELVGANLTGCDLTHCNFRGADLTKANLTGARLWNSDLTGANLSEADLTGCDLWNACLHKARIWHTDFKDAKLLSARNFAEDMKPAGKAMVDESGLLSAEEAYRGLKKFFLQNGMYNDASWASFREKTIERLLLKKSKNWHYLPSLVMNLLCGYGEKPQRIVLSALFTIFGFAVLYLLINGVQSSSSPGDALTWADYLYYSTVTFTTVGYGDFTPRPYPFFRLLASSEAFLGVFLTGLFIFTLARKYSAR